MATSPHQIFSRPLTVNSNFQWFGVYILIRHLFLLRKIHNASLIVLALQFLASCASDQNNQLPGKQIYNNTSINQLIRSDSLGITWRHLFDSSAALGITGNVQFTFRQNRDTSKVFISKPVFYPSSSFAADSITAWDFYYQKDSISPSLYFEQMKDIFLEFDTLEGLLLYEIYIDESFNAINGRLNNSIFKDSWVQNNVDFEGISFTGNTIFSGMQIDDSLIFDYCLMPDYMLFEDNYIGFIEFNYSYARDDNKCRLIFNSLGELDFSRVHLDYSQFKIEFPLNTDKNLINRYFQQIINTQKSKSYLLGMQEATIDRNRYTMNEIRFWVGYNWNKFGFDKSLILRNTIVLFSILFIPLWVFFAYFISNVYTPESMNSISNKINDHRNMNTTQRLLKTSPYAFYYASIIFFGLKMDTKNFHMKGDLESTRLKKKLAVSYIILVYLTGIVCTAYIANYIITR